MWTQSKGARFIERIRIDFGWLVLVNLVAVIAGTLYTFFVITPVYEASTEVWVSMPSSESGESIEMIDTYAVIATSDLVLEPVIENLALDHKPSSLRAQIEIEKINNSEVIAIKVRDENPYLAAKIANNMTNTFRDTIQNGNDANQIKILSEATVMASSVYPNYLKIITMSVMAKLIISVIVLIIRERMDQSVRTHEVAEEITGFRRIGNISTFTKEDLLILKVRSKKEVDLDSEEELLSRMDRRRV